MINKNTWDSFPGEYKEIIKNACYSNYVEVLSEYFYKNAKTLNILRSKHNIKISHYSPEIIKKFFYYSNQIIKENINNDIVYKKIYADWKSSINLFSEYHKYSDNEYLKYRLSYT